MEIIKDRVCAQLEGEAVVFLIGMRFNKPWKIHKWLPIASAMPRMLRELYAKPELGFLGHHAWFGQNTIMVQYWRSLDQLYTYAKNRNSAHLPAWAAFNRVVGKNGDVGIWHETYRTRAGDYETIYANMPLFGLAKATQAVPVMGRQETAAGRIERIVKNRGNVPQAANSSTPDNV